MLHRKLKKLTGNSASNRITEKRLKHAGNLLENDVATISEIAYRVGFSDPSYFNKVFKKHFNITPGDVRRNSTVDQNKLFTENDPENLISVNTKGYRSSVKIALIFLILIVTGGGVYYIFKGLRPSEISIAVLPFHNLTGQSENDYFVDGMHDALIGELGQLGIPRVISRTSTLRYRNSDMLLPDIAKELG